MGADGYETRGMAILGMALGHAALSILNAKKVISDAELDRMIQTVLAGLEDQFDPNDPGVETARKLAEGLMQAILKGRGTPSR
jgi:hypothetical protein